MADWDFILAPDHVTVEFRADPVPILLNSLLLLNSWDVYSGLGAWVMDTATHLTPEEKQNNADFSHHMFGAVHATTMEGTFPEFVARLEQTSPEALRDRAMQWMEAHDYFPGHEAVLASEEAFVQFMQRVWQEKNDTDETQPDLAEFQRIYRLFSDAPSFKQRLVSHLRHMWEKYLAVEWEHTHGTLEEAVEAYRQGDYDGLTLYEAIEAVTGRDIRGSEKLSRMLSTVRHLIFHPSPHLGPYIGFEPNDDENACTLLFGVRPPRNVPTTSPALSRSELLVRLNALADDTRLKMLELLVQREELCAQDFINELQLSQSSASRHLRQLTASGYLSERRRDVAKCYTLNRERIEDTIHGLKRFLDRQ